MEDETRDESARPVRITAEEVMGKQVKRIRELRGWSQQELARRMVDKGYSWRQTTVAKTEAADRPIRVNEVQGLAIVFGVTVNDLLAVPIDDFEMLGAASRLTELRTLAEAANQRVIELRRTRERLDKDAEAAEQEYRDLLDQIDEQQREYDEISARVKQQGESGGEQEHREEAER
ncbi:helix-turn-helix domain-containing protein [Streptomyces tendae]|uniref:Helix-turn-helix domain-containing protein n=1 Tax=Streptomyces tendae TaxID=1932 RepID=A0ABX5ZW93_STRTE|nr:helix-turn-helix transcriptional regulator [Streptomyces tendae]QER88599.1 helix-turn-helix domain-containing protein [Streptomyces tendae]